MSYNKAPIREAIFDVRIDRLNIKDISNLQEFKSVVIDDFPIEKKKHNVTGTFQFSPDQRLESKAHSDLTGFVFLSQDNTRQIQIRIDGFTLNILKPYENWDTHFNIFLKYWNEYNSLFKPDNITRIATRYINRIEIPLPFNSFQEYVVNMPPIPNCLPQTFANFFMQIQVPSGSENKHVVITETIEPVENNMLPFILDIDVFREANLNNKIENLVKEFNDLRAIKNQVFENCITDKTRTLFV
jgi:uncharacterized protein (TIGR04255 family)